jgi:diketogulonate reductase-like aldo/keto reductase
MEKRFLNRRELMQAAAAAALTTLSPPLLAEVRHIPRRVIPRTGESLAIIGMGNSSTFRNGDRKSSWKLISVFQDFGSNYIDVDGENRFVVADVVADHGLRDSVFLGAYFSGADDAGSRKEARRLLEVTGKSELDLMQAWPEDAGPHWDTFRKWRDDGLTRCIGVARHRKEYYPAMLDLLATGTVDFLQVNYSPLETEADQRVLPAAMDKGVAVTINRPFLNGRLFEIVRGHKLPEWAADFDCASWAQFSLKFILSHPAVNCVLTETANPTHARDNLGAGFGRLPDAKQRRKMVGLLQSLA